MTTSREQQFGRCVAGGALCYVVLPNDTFSFHICRLSAGQYRQKTHLPRWSIQTMTVSLVTSYLHQNLTSPQWNLPLLVHYDLMLPDRSNLTPSNVTWPAWPDPLTHVTTRHGRVTPGGSASRGVPSRAVSATDSRCRSQASAGRRPRWGRPIVSTPSPSACLSAGDG